MWKGDVGRFFLDDPRGVVFGPESSAFGEKKDKLGRRYCWDDNTGKRVKCAPVAKEKKERKPAAAKPTAAAKSPAAKPGAAPSAQDVVDYIHDNARQAAQGEPVLLRDMRKQLGKGVGKEEFDRAILDAARAGKIVVHRHDHPSLLTPQERDELVKDPDSGELFTLAAFRAGSAPERSAGTAPPAAGKPAPKGKPPPKKATAASAHTVDSVHAAILKAKAEPEKLTAEHLATFADMLGSLKVDEIKEVNKRLSGVKGSGAKAALVQDVLKRAGVKAAPEKPAEAKPPEVKPPTEEEALTAKAAKEKFTGTLTDSLGREYYFVDGERVAKPPGVEPHPHAGLGREPLSRAEAAQMVQRYRGDGPERSYRYRLEVLAGALAGGRHDDISKGLISTAVGALNVDDPQMRQDASRVISSALAAAPEAAKQEVEEQLRRTLGVVRGTKTVTSPEKVQSLPGPYVDFLEARGYTLPGQPPKAEPPGAKKPAAPSPKADKTALLAAVDRLKDRGGQADLHKLAAHLGWDVPRLHAAVQALRQEGVLTGQAIEGRGGVSEEQRRHALPEPGGPPIGSVGRREPTKPAYAGPKGGLAQKKEPVAPVPARRAVPPLSLPITAPREDRLAERKARRRAYDEAVRELSDRYDELKAGWPTSVSPSISSGEWGVEEARRRLAHKGTRDKTQLRADLAKAEDILRQNQAVVAERHRLRQELDAPPPARPESEWRAHPVLARLGDKLDIKDVDDPKVQQHLNELSLLPEGLVEDVLHFGLRGVFVGARSTPGLDSMGHLRGVRPRGWREGETWDGVAGAYHSTGRAVLAGVGRGRESGGLLLHEFGHGVGDRLGLDDDPELAGHHSRLWPKLDEYLQQEGPGGRAGRQELLAEAMADVLLDEDGARERFDDAFVDWFKSKTYLGKKQGRVSRTGPQQDEDITLPGGTPGGDDDWTDFTGAFTR